MTKAIGRAVGRGVLRVLIVIIRALPLPTGLAVGRALGDALRLLAGKRYRVALKNLGIAYGDSIGEPERRRIARECFRHFGMFAIEGIKFAWIPRSEVEERVRVDDYQKLTDVLESKRGVLLLSGHLGNFEIPGRWLTGRGHELFALARAARDQGTTRIMRSLRERMGIKVVTLNESLKPVLAGLKRNACVAIVCDQNAADVFVPFFGQPTGTVSGPARIAYKMGAPIVMYACTRDGRGGYRLTADDPIWPDTTANEQTEVLRLTTLVNEHLEAAIRRSPEQWLWFHDRWRASPGVAPSVRDAEAEKTAAPPR